MSDPFDNYVGEANPRSMFIEGPFGSGKTSFAIETLYVWLEAGVPPEDILVMVPQRTLARRYMLALRDPQRGPTGNVDVRTIGGLAKDTANLYWPLVADEMGFKHPHRPPRFLTIETSQYAMARFVDEAVQDGQFDAVTVSPQQIARQVIDNLGKAALLGIDYRDVPDLLIDAWGPDRPARRIYAYQAASRVAHAYRQYCLENRLLDYALQVEIFNRLMLQPDFQDRFFGEHTHLIIEHVEEESPLTHDLIVDWLPRLDGALLTYEWDGGYRVFLGADADNGYALREQCEGILTLGNSHITSPPLEALHQEITYSLRRAESEPAPEGSGVADAFQFEFHNYYPEMIEWVAETIGDLVHNRGVAPREIAVLAPFLSDALRFSLGQALDRVNVPHISHRPSRALRDEPAARCLLALTALAHPHWGEQPPGADVAAALGYAIQGLDPVRARLLTKVVYRPNSDEVLSPFDKINATMQSRITYIAGERYETLRTWLEEYRAGDVLALDHVFTRLFGEVLSQPGFGFQEGGDGERITDAGRVTDELVESARKFRQALFTDAKPNLDEVGKRYYRIVEQGLLAALYVASWRDELADAVFMAPAYTFLMRNRAVDVQFWLDVGSAGWWERLDQPLTHPYVLSHAWPQGQIWTDTDEFHRQQDMLYRVAGGLVRRCRQTVYLGISDLGEQGFEQRGPMLRIFQQILKRHGQSDTDTNQEQNIA